MLYILLKFPPLWKCLQVDLYCSISSINYGIQASKRVFNQKITKGKLGMKKQKNVLRKYKEKIGILRIL